MSQEPPNPGYPQQYPPQPGQQPAYPPQPGQQYPPQPGQQPYSPQPGQQPTYPPQPGQQYPPQQPGFAQAAPPPGFGYPSSPSGQPEMLGAYGTIAPPSPPGRKRSGLVIGGVAVAVVATVVAGGAFALNAMKGGGADQPEKHLPANTAAVATLDLDPSVSQKVDAVRFASKFPRSSFKESEDPRKSIWEDLVKDKEGAPTWAEVEPWMGNRAALAVLPSKANPAEAISVVVIAVSDEKKAAASLTRIKGVGSTVGDGWAYLSENNAEAAAALAAARKDTLADDTTFATDVKALGEDGIADVWFDGGKLTAFKGMLKKDERLSKLASGSSSVDVTGHGALALRFTGTSLEVSGTFAGVKIPIPTSATSGVEALPADTLAAIGVSGLGDLLAKSWPDLTKAMGDEASNSLTQLEEQTGLKMPGDLKTLLGTSTALAVGPAASGQTPAIALRVQTATDARKALDKVATLLDGSGMKYARKDFSGGYVLATTAEQAAAAAKGKGLESSERFTRAVPDHKGSGFVAYADITGLLKAYGSQMTAEDRKEAEMLDAFGMSLRQTGGDSYSLRLRLTTR